MAKPPKNHPWKLGLSGPVSYNRTSQSKWRGFYRPPEDDSPVRSLSASEIEELGLDLKIPIDDINEARKMCQQLHPDRGGDPVEFQYWKEKLDRLKIVEGSVRPCTPRWSKLCKAEVQDS